MPPLSVKVNQRNQITLPLSVRMRLKIKGGDRLLMDIQDGMLILSPWHHNYTEALAGLHREIWIDSNEYLKTERNSWNDELVRQG